MKESGRKKNWIRDILIIERGDNMKIFNYMNNTNSIMEKNTDKVQKGNSQTNEKHTVGQSVKLSISNEGLEY